MGTILWGLLHFRFESAVVQYFLPGRMLDTSNSTRVFVPQFIPPFQIGCSKKRKIKNKLKNVSFSWIEVYRGTDLLIVGTNVGRSFIPRQRVTFRGSDSFGHVQHRCVASQ